LQVGKGSDVLMREQLEAARMYPRERDNRDALIQAAEDTWRDDHGEVDLTARKCLAERKTRFDRNVTDVGKSFRQAARAFTDELIAEIGKTDPNQIRLMLEQKAVRLRLDRLREDHADLHDAVMAAVGAQTRESRPG